MSTKNNNRKRAAWPVLIGIVIGAGLILFGRPAHAATTPTDPFCREYDFVSHQLRVDTHQNTATETFELRSTCSVRLESFATTYKTGPGAAWDSASRGFLKPGRYSLTIAVPPAPCIVQIDFETSLTHGDSPRIIDTWRRDVGRTGCVKPPTPTTTVPVPPTTAPKPPSTTVPPVTTQPPVSTPQGPSASLTDVQNLEGTPAPAGELPRTGAPLMAIALMGGLMVGTGAWLVRWQG